MKMLTVLVAIMPLYVGLRCAEAATVVPVADLPTMADTTADAPADLWAFLEQPVEADRGLKIFGVAAMLVVAVGRLRFKDDGAER